MLNYYSSILRNVHWPAGRLRHAVLLAVWALVAMQPVWAEDTPAIEVQLQPQDIFMGENTTYVVEVLNIQSPSAPDLSDFEKDFTVKPAGDRSQNQTSINWVNGNLSQRTVYAHLYQYQLTPKRAGLLTVPAPTVLMEGRKISGVPAQLRVRAQEKQDMVLCEIIPSKTRVYPTQPFDITLKVLIKPVPGAENRDPLSLINPVDLSIDWLKAPDALTTSDPSAWLNTFLTKTGHGFTLNNLNVNADPMDDPFAMFEGRHNAVFSLYTGREERKGLDGKPIAYFVYELKRTFTPQKTGSFTFGPATLKGSFAETVNGRTYTPRRMVLNSAPATVEVREVPGPLPATFCGGIGNYKVAASATPMALRVGDPLTLKVEFEREKNSGGLELISAPDVSANPQIASDFEVIDKNPTGEVNGDKKTFTYGLRPKKPGATIPALTVSLFNVDTEKFNDVSTGPIDLKVTQSAQLGAGDLVSNAQTQKALEIRNRQGGVFQNFQDITALQDQRSDPLFYTLAAILVWVFCGAASLLITRQRRLSNDAAWQRRQRARPEADASLRQAREALTKADAHAAGKFTRAAITGLIGNLCDLPAAGMTAQEAKGALTAANVGEALRTRTVELLEKIEALEYAPSAGENVTGMIDAAEKILPELQRELVK
jgi:hypothetical protein